MHGRGGGGGYREEGRSKKGGGGVRRENGGAKYGGGRGKKGRGKNGGQKGREMWRCGDLGLGKLALTQMGYKMCEIVINPEPTHNFPLIFQICGWTS